LPVDAPLRSRVAAWVEFRPMRASERSPGESFAVGAAAGPGWKGCLFSRCTKI